MDDAARVLNVLLVEDSEDDALLVLRELRRAGWQLSAERVETPDAMASALATRDWDVVLADYSLPRFTAVDALRMLQARHLDVPFIIVSGAIGEETAVAAMKAGAHDYVMKGHLGRLVPAIERELREANDRRALARARAEREGMEQAARRSEKLAALGTLAAGLAHELNNPIGIMSSRIELMLTDAAGLSDEAREDLQVLHRQTQRVARITQGLLSFARRSPGDAAPVDLNHVVTETVMLVERQLAKAGVRVTVELAPDLPAILGDADTLQQVVLNLVTNARDVLADGGELRIATAVRPGEPAVVELTVEDNGPGIAPEHLTHVFDPFFTTKPTGTGLGLSITHGIVREHRGTIDVHSVPGDGTRFVLTFPALNAALDR